MTEKRGLDKYVTPNGFWDKFITYNVLATAGLGISWLNFSNGVVDGNYFAGLLIGLFCGQLANCIAEFATAKPKIRESLRPIYLVLTVIIFFVFIFVFSSARLAGGYFFGLSITLFFGGALSALVRKYKEPLENSRKT